MARPHKISAKITRARHMARSFLSNIVSPPGPFIVFQSSITMPPTCEEMMKNCVKYDENIAPLPQGSVQGNGDIKRAVCVQGFTPRQTAKPDLCHDTVSAKMHLIACQYLSFRRSVSTEKS